MNKTRSASAVLATLALAGAALPIGAIASTPAKHVATSARDRTVILHERVRASGVYDVHVAISSRSSNANAVSVKIGDVSRHASTRADRHAKLNVKVPVTGRTLSISATAARGKPKLKVELRRMKALPAKTRAATGSKSVTSAPAAPAAPAAAPAPAAPAWTPGSPAITVPSGFAPIASYTNQVENFEFNGSSLPSDWTAGTDNYGYQATQYQPSQVSLTGSSAALTAINKTSPQGDPYTSGWISTAGQYSLTHGEIDFRVQMPAGQGLWPGLWLDQANGSNPWGEIDAAEMLLSNTTTVYGSLHGWAPSPQWHETQQTSMAASATAGFNDYQVVWQPGMVTWAINGVAYAQYTAAQAAAAGYPWPFDNSTGLYLIANLAVGASSDWGGAPDAATAFPATMQVQSVKVWQ